MTKRRKRLRMCLGMRIRECWRIVIESWGGEITLIAKPGVGHVHGLEDSTPIIEFVVKSCGGR